MWHIGSVPLNLESNGLTPAESGSRFRELEEDDPCNRFVQNELPGIMEDALSQLLSERPNQPLDWLVQRLSDIRDERRHSKPVPDTTEYRKPFGAAEMQHQIKLLNAQPLPATIEICSTITEPQCTVGGRRKCPAVNPRMQ